MENLIILPWQGYTLTKTKAHNKEDIKKTFEFHIKFYIAGDEYNLAHLLGELTADEALRDHRTALGAQYAIQSDFELCLKRRGSLEKEKTLLLETVSVLRRKFRFMLMTGS